MKNVMALAAPVLMTSAVLADASGSYGWEDGVATSSPSQMPTTLPYLIALKTHMKGIIASRLSKNHWVELPRIHRLG